MDCLVSINFCIFDEVLYDAYEDKVIFQDIFYFHC